MCIKTEQMVIVLKSAKYLSDQPIVWPDIVRDISLIFNGPFWEQFIKFWVVFVLFCLIFFFCFL